MIFDELHDHVYSLRVDDPAMTYHRRYIEQDPRYPYASSTFQMKGVSMKYGLNEGDAIV